MPETLSLDHVADLLRPGMRVFVPGASNEPVALLEALAARPDKTAGVTFVQFPLPGMNQTDFAGWHAQTRMESFFLSPAIRASFAAGKVDFLPLHMRRVYTHLATCAPFDLVLIQVGRDAQGVLRHGPNVDFLEAVLGNRVRVLAEENRALTMPVGGAAIDPAEIDYLVESNHPLPELARPSIDADSATIGREVARLIPDGACIQTGIGSIPAAVLAALSDHNDLGMHGGLLDAAGLDLIEQGAVTGAHKEIDRSRHVTGMALGDADFYDRLAERSDVVFKPARYTHEVGVMSELQRFVSINSAVEVDLLGQVSAEMVGGKQISGTGGSVDFMRGAAASLGGRSIVAMTATARRGTVSRIVPAIATGSVVTAARTDVDTVVTEHGVAELKGRSLDARAAALIDIAAPQVRDELRAAWRERRASM